jgi:hypothetical protein
MIDLEYRDLNEKLMQKLNSMQYTTVNADNGSANDITISIFDNTNGFYVNPAAENIITNKAELLQINTEIGMNPILVHYIRLNKRLYDTLADVQWQKLIRVFHSSPRGATERRQIRPITYLSARYNANFNDILIYFENPVMIDVERYIEWDIMGKTEVNMVFYYTQLKIKDFLLDFLKYQTGFKYEDILGQGDENRDFDNKKQIS